MDRWNLAELSYDDVRSKPPFEVAVLPLGATEPHNLHLPYGTDTLQVLTLNFTLGPGRYNMAVAVNNTTAQVIRFNPPADTFGFIASETMWGSSSFPLPAAFTINQFPNYAPFMGIAKGTVI